MLEGSGWDVLAGIAKDAGTGMIFLYLYMLERRAHKETADRCRDDLRECIRREAERENVNRHED